MQHCRHGKKHLKKTRTDKTLCLTGLARSADTGVQSNSGTRRKTFMVDSTPPTPPDMGSSARVMTPLRDLSVWTHHFLQADIPVLASSAQALEALRAVEDDVDANTLAKVIDADPLLSIKYLAHAANRRRVSDSSDTETVLSSLVMTGVLPFFNHFGPQPTVEDRLMDLPLALEALQRLMHRATRAGNFALAFAVHRGSTDAAVIHQAAFLHDFAEMLMLCHAPTMELQIQGAMRADPTLRTAKAQRDVLNIELDDLRQELFKRWHLPQLLVRISDDKHLDHSNVLCAQLAVRLARHTMEDWDNAAIPDDIEAIAKLLNAAPRVALAFAKKVDLQCL